MKTSYSLSAALLVLGISSATMIQSALAQTTWTGATDTDWNTAGNWSSGVPDSADLATFSSTTGAKTVTLNGNQLVNGLSFTQIATTTFAKGTPTTSTLTIGAGGISANAGSGCFGDVAVNLVLAANQTWNSSNLSYLKIGDGSTITNGGFTATIDGNSTVNITGAISGTGGLIKNGAGILGLYGAKSFEGGVALNSGYVRVSASTSLGTGTFSIAGGRIGTLGSAVAISNAVSVTGNFDFSSATATLHALTLNGTMDLNGAQRTITQGETTAEGGHFINGVVSNGGITKAGVGILTLGGVNTYTGNTAVSAGTLILADNSQSAFTIGANGVNNQFNGTGTLTLNGDFSFNLGDAGTALNDSWNIVTVGTLAATFGSTFGVVGFTEISGTLWEITNVNGGRTYRFDETTGNLAVTAVPEPATWALLAGSLTVVMVLRRRGNKKSAIW